MFTADQLVAHLVGDWLLQSHWMATQKFTNWGAALLHVVVYGLCFLPLQPSPAALAVIVGSHLVIDRWRLARHVIYAKNWAFGFGTMPPWSECSKTGFPPTTPEWLSVWLMIFTDQVIHVLCNGAALRWL